MIGETVEKYGEAMAAVYAKLIECGAAEAFAEAMRLRAETTARDYANIPAPNRDCAMGQISICYELADGASAALKEREADDKVERARRIRREVLGDE